MVYLAPAEKVQFHLIFKCLLSVFWYFSRYVKPLVAPTGSDSQLHVCTAIESLSVVISFQYFAVSCELIYFFSLRVRWQQLPMMSPLIFHSPWWCFKASWSLSVERRKSLQRWVFIQAETDWACQNSGNDSNDRSKLSSENYEMAKNQNQMHSFKTIRDWGCQKYPRFLFS